MVSTKPNPSVIELPALKVIQADIEVEYDFSLSVPDEPDATQAALDPIHAGLARVEAAIQVHQAQVNALSKDIERLTDQSDLLDNLVAVGSGLIAGLVDSLWVGEFDFQQGKAWSNHTVNDFVMRTAKAQGYQGERLDGAIKFLEDKFPVPHDNIWKGKDVGISARSHHLDDLAHHPTPVGLFFSILTQFTKQGYFQNAEGAFLPITIDEKGLELIGTDIPTKIFCGTVNWFFHLVSDMSGSNKTAGVGMGVPGPIVSLLKELGTLPVLDRTGLPQKMKEAFVKERFDLRSEMAVMHQLGRQAVPVMLNEVLVRAFYFLRRLVMQWRVNRSFNDIDWKQTLPWHNRTIARMLTIATGTFTAADLADAAIRAGMRSGGNPAAFGMQMLLRVNFVGVGRFAIAVYTDVSMGVQRERLRDQRIALLSAQLHWVNAQVAYRQAGMWQAAQRTDIALVEAERVMYEATVFAMHAWEANRISLREIGQIRGQIERRNPHLLDDIRSILS